MQDYLLEKAGVATLAGTSFGAHGEGFVRLSYANSVPNIRQALQRIKEAERENTYERFSQREGEIVSGRVQRFIPRTGDVIVNIEQSEGVLSREDQLPNERYHRGSPIRAYLMEVKRGNRGTALRLSRTHRHMLRRLLEGQVPEVDKGIVEIKSIAREPDSRISPSLETQTSRIWFS